MLADEELIFEQAVAREALRLAFERRCAFRPQAINALNAAGIEWEVGVETTSDRAIEATADTFYERVRELAGQGGRGCNVTVPFKHAAWRLAERRSERSDLAEAANTLCFDADGWFADNTDGGGLLFDLEIGAGFSLEGARICLLGAGGAAAGVTAALLQARPSLLLIANRSASRAAALAEAGDDEGGGEAAPEPPSQVVSEAPPPPLVEAQPAPMEELHAEVRRARA